MPVMNYILAVYIVVYLVNTVLSLVIDRLNLKHLETYGKKVPSNFEGIIDEQELITINRYTVDKLRFTLFQTGFHRLFFLFIIFSGILPWLAESLSRTNDLWAGLIFFAALGLLLYTAALPFDYYHSFVIEARYGFNTKTLGTWLQDLVKSLLLTAILGTLLLLALLSMIKYAGPTWWIWAWAFVLGFQFVMAILYPTIIAPLFNTFTPLDDAELKTGIENLASGQSLSIDGIYQMDATRRTRHTNAYFSGLGKAKRIVLYDTLIQSHAVDEIIAVLAHEVGHLKKNHIKKQLALTGIISLFLFFLASKLLTHAALFESFGFSSMPHYAGLFLAGVIWEPVGFWLAPLGMAVSRKFEREADYFSLKILNTPKPLAAALKKMARDNLANLQPHPLYVWFNYSHPPLVERINYLEGFDLH
ncbi:MAG: M48 family metallopeptidase [Proteobacteria bacterium]|nr:M48 family metallopeptidase [Pseudomonadota bacterium]